MAEDWDQIGKQALGGQATTDPWEAIGQKSLTATAEPPRGSKSTGAAPEDHAEAERLLSAARNEELGKRNTATWTSQDRLKALGKDYKSAGSVEVAQALADDRTRRIREEGEDKRPGAVMRGLGASYAATKAGLSRIATRFSDPFVPRAVENLREAEQGELEKDIGRAWAGEETKGSFGNVLSPPSLRPSYSEDVGPGFKGKPIPNAPAVREKGLFQAAVNRAVGPAADVQGEVLPAAFSLTMADPANAAIEGVTKGVGAGVRAVQAARTVGTLRREAPKAVGAALDAMEETRATGAFMDEAARLQGADQAITESAKGRASLALKGEGAARQKLLDEAAALREAEATLGEAARAKGLSKEAVYAEQRAVEEARGSVDVPTGKKRLDKATGKMVPVTERRLGPQLKADLEVADAMEQAERAKWKRLSDAEKARMAPDEVARMKEFADLAGPIEAERFDRIQRNLRFVLKMQNSSPVELPSVLRDIEAKMAREEMEALIEKYNPDRVSEVAPSGLAKGESLPGGHGRRGSVLRPEQVALKRWAEEQAGIDYLPMMPDPKIGTRVGVGKVAATRKVGENATQYRVDYPDGSFKWSPAVNDADTLASKVLAGMEELPATPEVPSGVLAKRIAKRFGPKGGPKPTPPAKTAPAASKPMTGEPPVKPGGTTAFAFPANLSALPPGVAAKVVGAGVGGGIGAATAPEDASGWETALRGAAGGALGAGLGLGAVRASGAKGGLLSRLRAFGEPMAEGKAFLNDIAAALPSRAATYLKANTGPRTTEALREILGSASEAAHPAVAELMDEALRNSARIKGFAHPHRISLQDAFGGLKPRSAEELAVHLYQGGEAQAPPFLSLPQRQAVEGSKRYIQDLRKRGTAARAGLPETLEEYAGGWLPREYENAPGKPVMGIFRRGKKGAAHGTAIDEFRVRQDAEGLVVKAPLKEVEDALRRLAPGTKPLRAPTAGSEGVLVKVGRGKNASDITDQLAAQFNRDQIVLRIREKPLSERLAWGEKMNPAERFVAAVDDLEQRVVSAEFLKGIHDRMAVKVTPGGQIPAGYAQVAKDPRFGWMSGAVVPEKVARFVEEKGSQIGEFGRFVLGGNSAMTEGMIATERGVAQNVFNNVFLNSIFTDVNPALNVDALPRWGSGLYDLAQYGRRGAIPRKLHAAIYEGLDVSGITPDIVDDMERISVGLNALNRETDLHKVGKGIVQLLSGDPHFRTGIAGAKGAAADVGVSATTGAAHGAIRGALTGGNIAGEAAMAAARGAGLQPAARFAKFAFGVADPWYQYVAFSKQMDMALARGYSWDEAAKWAMQQVRRGSQEFRPQKLPAWFNKATGRAPITSLREGLQGPTQVALRTLSVPFVTFPYNFVRMAATNAVRKPVDTALYIFAGDMVYDAAVNKRVRDGKWTQKEADAFRASNPDDIPYDGENKQVRLMGKRRFWPGFSDVLGDAGKFPVGLGLSALIRTGSALGTARGGGTEVPDPRTGYNLMRQDERQHGYATAHRLLTEGTGGSMTPYGTIWGRSKDTIEGKKDLGGQRRKPMDTIMDLVFGIQLRDYSPRAETRKVNKGFNIDLKEQERAKRGAKRGATPDAKKEADETFRERRDELRQRRDERKGLPR